MNPQVTVSHDGVSYTGTIDALWRLVAKGLLPNSVMEGIGPLYYSSSHGGKIQISTMATVHIANAINKLVSEVSRQGARELRGGSITGTQYFQVVTLQWDKLPNHIDKEDARTLANLLAELARRD